MLTLQSTSTLFNVFCIACSAALVKDPTERRVHDCQKYVGASHQSDTGHATECSCAPNNCSPVPGHYATMLCLFWLSQPVPAAITEDLCIAMMIKIPQHSWLAKDSRGVLTLEKLCTSLFYSAVPSLNTAS